MKAGMFPVLAGLVLVCAHASAQTQESRERISRSFTLPAGASASTLVIYNVNGLINVEGGTGAQVAMEIDQRITAKDAENLQKGKQEVKLAFEQRNDTLFAYIAEPFDSRPNRNNRWNQNEEKLRYDFTLDYTVKVPRGMNVYASTINRGKVTIKDVTGSIRARNINGAIELVNAVGATDAHTINGNVEANYLSTPPDKSSYYTLNGDIRISYPANLSADLQFKSFQGEFYTDFPEAEVQPAQVVKNEERQGDKTVYKLNKTSSIRIGKGGKTLRFETFNGSVYIKKQS